MVGDPGFRAVIDKHIRRATALVAVVPGETGLLDALLFSAKPRPIMCDGWSSPSARRRGVGGALMTEATRRFPPGPVVAEVMTFGADHPGAAASGARALYERLGFAAAEAAAPGPEAAPGRSTAGPLPDAPASS